MEEEQLLEKIEAKLRHLASLKDTIGYKKLAMEIGMMEKSSKARRPPRLLYDMLLKVGERNYRERGPINGLVVRINNQISGKGFFIWYADKYFPSKSIEEMMKKSFYEENVKNVCFQLAESKQLK